MMSNKVVVSARLGGSGIGDPFGINPVFGLLILRIVNLLGWVDRRVEVCEQATCRRLSIVDGDGISVIGAENTLGCQSRQEANGRRVLNHKGVQLGGLIDRGHRTSSEVFFLVFTGDGVLVAEDEMNLGETVRIRRWQT